MSGVRAIRDCLSVWKPRMHSFAAAWWSSCSRFKHCAMSGSRTLLLTNECYNQQIFGEAWSALVSRRLARETLSICSDGTTLCIDEAFPGFNQSGRGKRLFGDDGKPTPYVENVLKFLGQYQLEFQRTQAFCKKLKDLNLLEPMQAQITFGSGQRMALGASRSWTACGSRPCRAMCSQLVQSDELELIYAHLVSMRNFATLRDRLAEAQPAHSADGGPLIH